MNSQDSFAGDGKRRILLVDDHPLVRIGLASLVDSEAGLEVCGSTGDIHEALQLAAETNPDLAVVDLSLSEGSGLDLIKRLKAHHPKLKLLVCSMHDESLFAARVLKAGVLGYVNKQQASEQVIAAIRKVLAGEIYLSPQMTQQMLQGAMHKTLGGVDDLTDRELEVYSLIGRGYKTSKIAETLHLSVKTIETHREKIKRKLNLSSGSELSRHAARWEAGNG